MKLKSKIIMIFLVMQLVCIFALTGCGSSTPHIFYSLERQNIDTQLLKDYEIVCDIKGETFTGIAPCYGVILFENEPTDFLQSFSTEKSEGFSSEKKVELEEKLEYYIDMHSDLEVPSEYLPNWDEEYMWYVSGGFDKKFYSDTLFMVYFPNDYKLVIFEMGH